MRNTTTLLLVLALVGLTGLASAQSVMPMPAFSNTYTYTFSRGFYMQAPVDFTIVGLQVPDESQNGTQNVVVYKPVALPPYIPGTTGGLQFFKAGEPSNIVIPCRIPFKAGEWVGILGACGNATTLHNSYGSGPFQSNVLGTVTSIYRFGMQANFVANQGNANYWGTPLGSLGRVWVHVSSASVSGSGSGSPGTDLDFTLSAAGDPNLPYQLGSSFGNGPIPIDNRSLELSPDNLLVLSVGGLIPAFFQNYSGILDSSGKASARLAIPNLPVLKGIRIYTAFVTLNPSAPTGVQSISNSFLFTIQ